MARARQVFGYDSDLMTLYYKDEEGGVGRYTEIGAKFVLMDGRHYAAWRLKSAVLLGTVNARTKKQETRPNDDTTKSKTGQRRGLGKTGHGVFQRKP